MNNPYILYFILMVLALCINKKYEAFIKAKIHPFAPIIIILMFAIILFVAFTLFTN